MAHNNVNNLLNITVNNNNEPLGNIKPVRSGSQQDDSTGKNHYDGNESIPSRVERNARCARSTTPDDSDYEHVANNIIFLRAQQRKIMNHLKIGSDNG